MLFGLERRFTHCFGSGDRSLEVPRQVRDGAEIGTHSFFDLVFAESGNLPLRMVSKSFLQAQLDKLKTVEKYTVPLTMEKAEVVKKPGDEGDGEPPSKKSKEEPSTSSVLQPEDDMVESVIRREDRVLGRKPSKRKAPFKGGKTYSRGVWSSEPE